YLVGTAILRTAYTSASNRKYSGVATAVAGTAIGLTLLSAAVGLHEVNLATLAEPPLAELQARIAGRLHIKKFRMAPSKTRVWQRRGTVIITFGLAIALDIGALWYAATR